MIRKQKKTDCLLIDSLTYLEKPKFETTIPFSLYSLLFRCLYTFISMCFSTFKSGIMSVFYLLLFMFSFGKHRENLRGHVQTLEVNSTKVAPGNKRFPVFDIVVLV